MAADHGAVRPLVRMHLPKKSNSVIAIDKRFLHRDPKTLKTLKAMKANQITDAVRRSVSKIVQWGVCLGVCALISVAEAAGQFADSVVSVRFGPNFNAGFGPDNPHFPRCVLGRPDSTARPCAPTADPRELLSLGDGGEITLYFRRPIVNREGPDFIVFENAFYIGCDTNRAFMETGIVSVSRDGQRFVEFPFSVIDTLPINSPRRYRGLAGVTPTNGTANPQRHGPPLIDGQLSPFSGGDAFDLAVIGMDSIHYVRITDAGSRVNDGGILANSFDLDAVVAIHQAGASRAPEMYAQVRSFKLRQNYPNPFNPTTTIGYELKTPSDVSLKVYDELGREVATLVEAKQAAGVYKVPFNAAGLASGIYIYRLQVGAFAESRKMMLIK